MPDPDRVLTAAVVAADRTHNQAIADARELYEVATQPAREALVEALAAANRARDEAYAAAAEAYGRAVMAARPPANLIEWYHQTCPECCVPWDQPSPDCPKVKYNRHPLGPVTGAPGQSDA